jgi:hypothetical protein
MEHTLSLSLSRQGRGDITDCFSSLAMAEETKGVSEGQSPSRKTQFPLSFIRRGQGERFK